MCFCSLVLLHDMPLGTCLDVRLWIFVVFFSSGRYVRFVLLYGHWCLVVSFVFCLCLFVG